MTSVRPRKMEPIAKRAAVLRNAEYLFASQGFAGTTMAQIAAQADVAVGTLYRLFPDKLMLLQALHDAMENRFIAAMQTGWNSVSDCRARFDPMIDALLDEVVAAQETMSLYMLTRDIVSADGVLPGTKTIAVIARQYEEGIRAGAFRPHPTDVVASMAYGMVEGAMRAWMMEPTLSRRMIVTQELKALFARAFLTD